MQSKSKYLVLDNISKALNVANEGLRSILFERNATLAEQKINFSFICF